MSQKNCAKLFLSELRQISTNFDNFWQRDGKEAKIMRGALTFHLNYFASSHYTVLNADVPNYFATQRWKLLSAINFLTTLLAHSKLKCGDLFSKIISSYNTSGQKWCQNLCMNCLKIEWSRNVLFAASRDYAENAMPHLRLHSFFRYGVDG